MGIITFIQFLHHNFCFRKYNKYHVPLLHRRSRFSTRSFYFIIFEVELILRKLGAISCWLRHALELSFFDLNWLPTKSIELIDFYLTHSLSLGLNRWFLYFPKHFEFGVAIPFFRIEKYPYSYSENLIPLFFFPSRLLRNILRPLLKAYLNFCIHLFSRYL